MRWFGLIALAAVLIGVASAQAAPAQLYNKTVSIGWSVQSTVRDPDGRQAQHLQHHQLHRLCQQRGAAFRAVVAFRCEALGERRDHARHNSNQERRSQRPAFRRQQPRCQPGIFRRRWIRRDARGGFVRCRLFQLFGEDHPRQGKRQRHEAEGVGRHRAGDPLGYGDEHELLGERR